MEQKPTTEDRVWAVLSHLSALAFGMGILLPVIGWSEQRRKSKYASFQCLQALGYQSLGFTVWFLSYLLLIVIFLIAMVLLAGVSGSSGNSSDRFMGMWVVFLVAIVLVSFGVYFAFPIIAAISCGLGLDFRYPILGNRLARFLGYQQAANDSEWLIEEHEDRWVAAMGHFSIIIVLWGLLAPLTTWIVRGKHSMFLKFQSIQTVAYQGCVTLLAIGAAVIYMFGFTVFLGLTGFEGNSNGSITSTNMIGLVFLIVAMIVAMLIILIVPLFHILGQWAGYRVLKGDNYRYPFIGSLTERWIANQTELTAEDGGSSIQTL
jgi:uncharacterized Tic20 family protein